MLNYISFLQDCCLIPESPFYLEGKGGLLEFIEKRLKENGHMVIVVAEGAGQDLLVKSMQSMDHEDASGNKLLLDVGLWLSQKIKVDFLDYIDAGFCLHDHKLLVKILTGTFCIGQDHFSSNKKKMSINLKYIGMAAECNLPVSCCTQLILHV